MPQTTLLNRSILIDEYVRQGLSSKVIGAGHGVAATTVLAALRRHGLDVRPAYIGGRRYVAPAATGFVGPATDWHAYWIGFLLAHGSYDFHADTRHTLRVTLRSADAGHLENLREGLGTDAPLRTIRRNDGTSAACLIVCSRELSDALGGWGIVPRKTGSMRFPAVDTRWQEAVLRGYWDAHGTVSGSPGQVNCNFVSGSVGMLLDVAGVLEGHDVRCLGRWPLSGSAQMLAVSRQRENLARLCAVLYADATVWLERTRQRLGALTYVDGEPPSWMRGTAPTARKAAAIPPRTRRRRRVQPRGVKSHAASSLTE